MEVKIVNMVATGACGYAIDLTMLCNVKYHPEKFRAATYRLQKTSGSVQIFGNGSLVFLGQKSTAESQVSLQELETMLIEQGYTKFKDRTLTVRNIVVSVKTKPLNLSTVYEKLRLIEANVSYETELFPGLIVKFPTFTCTMFTSGKINVTGLKDVDDIGLVKSYIKPLI